ncbi:hypothetical protein FUA23_15890 [Neolewinella aurantiaca]|uniref:Uncharacterized protein n=1 Tax=Neolewinella aurantiaca TaxID=2602767 RepID=A0A5C7FEY1_9BACT|nr:hypothetical protein [Neolewinella aurantiaca]TXF88121.1 hypothetical protein FUA23_15890 [Neolewinella aurantiaca]
MSPLAVAFLATTFLTIFLFVRSHRDPGPLAFYLSGYAALQYGIATTGFYENTEVLPPPFLLNVVPAIVFVIWLFVAQRGKAFAAGFMPDRLLWVHFVRMPVELILFGLFTAGLVPEVMTFAGSNFDILAGLSAPVVWYLAYYRKLMSPALLRAWHIAASLLLLNIVASAVLSVPLPIQQFGLEQPNLALLMAPYNLLPAVVVPLVIVGHIAGFRTERGEVAQKPA